MVAFPKRYKSARLVQGQITIQDRDFLKERLTEDSLVLQPTFMGICRADIKEITASRDIPTDRGPLFGHELLAKIVFAGQNTDYSKGAFVTFNPNVTPDRTTGFADDFFINGNQDTFQEAVIPITESNLFDSPWMPEPFACIIHSTNKLMELLNVEDFRQKKIAIIGAGNSGILFGLLIKHLRGRIKVFNRGDMRIHFVKDNHIFAGSEVEKLDNYGQWSNLFDYVIVVPTMVDSDILEKAFTMVKNGGDLHLYGGTRKDDRFLGVDVPMDNIRRNELIEKVTYQAKDISISGAYGCARKDFEEVFRIVNKFHEEFPVSELTSKVISLNELPNVMMGMASGIEDYPGKVLVKNTYVAGF